MNIMTRKTRKGFHGQALAFGQRPGKNPAQRLKSPIQWPRRLRARVRILRDGARRRFVRHRTARRRWVYFFSRGDTRRARAQPGRATFAMPYVIFTANGEEYDRRELTRPMVLGRAPDCDISIPDITLSRRHCRLEPSENGRSWQLVDLHSKNGTHFRGQKVETHVFRDNDELRVGRTRLTFKAGAFVSTTKVKTRGLIRPADPHEALAGTVTGMVLCEPGETEKYEGMPVPQPRPSDPKSFENDDVYGMINEIVSSSWDSVQAQASEPTRMQRATPVPGVTTAASGPVRPKPRVSFALQADNKHDSVNGEAVALTHDTTSPAVATPRKRGTHEALEPLTIGSVLSSLTTSPPLAPAAPARPAGPAEPGWLVRKMEALERAIRNVPQRWIVAMATTAAIALLFVGWVSFLLHITRDPGPATSPRSVPESPAAMPDVTDATPQPAATLSFFQ
jgi:pSer/pThr/pTyr-binding forkhead associated (FHA) protein